MAGNFWQSSHYLQWILDKQDLMKERQKDLKFLTEEEYWKLQIFFANGVVGQKQGGNPKILHN
uniref:Cyclin C n=1 Tax=Erpetoichthys calabaricus TaxID=27687 RepID=A0A8C4RWI2_ERPCA